jgi:hypothetical protein
MNKLEEAIAKELEFTDKSTNLKYTSKDYAKAAAKAVMPFIDGAFNAGVDHALSPGETLETSERLKAWLSENIGE